jgi:hypothetical protein
MSKVKKNRIFDELHNVKFYLLRLNDAIIDYEEYLKKKRKRKKLTNKNK